MHYTLFGGLGGGGDIPANVVTASFVVLKVDFSVMGDLMLNYTLIKRAYFS